MRIRHTNSKWARRQGGYMLLTLMFFVVLLTFSMMATLPRIQQQVKRDREEEMIHRGTEYERAIKKFYKKFNRFPNSLEDLENTNNVRFIRKRYKDPMSKDGNWKLLHITDVQQGISNPNFGVSQAGNFSPAQGGMGGPSLGATGTLPQTNTGGFVSAPGGAQNSGGPAPVDPSTTGNPGDPAAVQPGSPTGTANAPGSATGGQPGQTYGAGGVVGVESVSKVKSVREFGGKANYNKWMFIYDPTQDRGTLLKGPYNPQAFQGVNAPPSGAVGNIGTTPGVNPQQPGAQQGSGYSVGPGPVDPNAPPQ
jgi:type II secretory pathway pseudopilin PulG